MKVFLPFHPLAGNVRVHREKEIMPNSPFKAVEGGKDWGEQLLR